MLVQTYAPVFSILAVAGLVAGLFFFLASVLGKKKPTPEKMQPYECGSESSGGGDITLSLKFYLTAILFVVFDIESVFVYPWALHFRALGWAGMIEMLSFLAVVLVALI